MHVYVFKWVINYRKRDSELRDAKAVDRNPPIRVHPVQAESETNGEGAAGFKRPFQHQEILRRQWPRPACCCCLFQCAERNRCEKTMRKERNFRRSKQLGSIDFVFMQMHASPMHGE